MLTLLYTLDEYHLEVSSQLRVQYSLPEDTWKKISTFLVINYGISGNRARQVVPPTVMLWGKVRLLYGETIIRAHDVVHVSEDTSSRNRRMVQVSMQVTQQKIQ